MTTIERTIDGVRTYVRYQSGTYTIAVYVYDRTTAAWIRAYSARSRRIDDLMRRGRDTALRMRRRLTTLARKRKG